MVPNGFYASAHQAAAHIDAGALAAQAPVALAAGGLLLALILALVALDRPHDGEGRAPSARPVSGGGVAGGATHAL